MLVNDIIRAEDYLPESKESGNSDSMQLSKTDIMLINLFGTKPDYSNRKFEKLWHKVFFSEDKDIISYCLEKGIDVLGKNEELVTGWRDIAVMLKAIDNGLLYWVKRKEQIELLKGMINYGKKT